MWPFKVNDTYVNTLDMIIMVVRYKVTRNHVHFLQV